jgi:hypothetical protein
MGSEIGREAAAEMNKALNRFRSDIGSHVATVSLTMLRISTDTK